MIYIGEHLHQGIAVRLVEFSILSPHIDPLGETPLNNVIDVPLYWIEGTPESSLVGFWELENWRSKHYTGERLSTHCESIYGVHLLSMRSPNHELRQSNEQTFRMLHVPRIAVIVLKYLEATSVWYIEKLEVGVELCERVEYWGPTESPLIRVWLADISETVEK